MPSKKRQRNSKHAAPADKGAADGILPAIPAASLAGQAQLPTGSQLGRWYRLRWLVAVVSLAVAMISVAAAIGAKTLRLDRRPERSTVDYNELTKSGIDLKTNESSNFFDLSLLVVGSLVGLMLAKSDETRLTLQDKPELLMAIGSGLLLLSSMLCHDLYFSAVSEACLRATPVRMIKPFEKKTELKPGWKTETVVNDAPKEGVQLIESKLTMVDISDPGIESLIQGQLYLLLLGTGTAAATILSARYLKER